MERLFVNYPELIKRARINNCFIYQKSKKRWFTPDELEAETAVDYNNDSRFRGRPDYHDDFALYDPWASIKFYHKWLVAITERITDLQKKIDEHYVVESKAKRKR